VGAQQEAVASCWALAWAVVHMLVIACYILWLNPLVEPQGGKVSERVVCMLARAKNGSSPIVVAVLLERLLSLQIVSYTRHVMLCWRKYM
jgi:hypothetical protein